MKILLYGTCSFPYFFREFLRVAAQRKSDIDWRVIVLSWRHLALYKGVIADEHLFYVHSRVNELMTDKRVDLSVLSTYEGSVFRDLFADKRLPGQLRTKSKNYQLRTAIAFYRAYKEYLIKEKPDVIFLPLIETLEGFVLYKAAVELGIKTFFHCSARNLKLSFFSLTPFEAMPPNAMTNPVPAEFIKKAEEYLENFRKNPHPAYSVQYEPPESEIVAYGRSKAIHEKIWKFPMFVWNLAKDQILEPHAARPNPIWYQPHIQLWALNKMIWSLKAKTRGHFFDIHSADQLPPKFVYFPLHMSPELSLTTYAPFFEDQIRAIDLILLHMPSDHYLVVKEHPVMNGMRPAWFYKDLKKKAGVLLTASGVSGTELIRRSALTAIVTGTAGMEALFLGKPSMSLGCSFFSPWLTQGDSFEHLDQTIREAMRRSPEDMHAKAVDLIARVFMVGHTCYFKDPHDPDFPWKYTMNKTNVNNFYDAFMRFLPNVQ